MTGLVVSGVSAVGFAGLVNVDSPFSLLNNTGCLWNLVEFGDFEESAALPALYSLIGGVVAEHPVCAALWTFSNDLHR